MSHREDLLARYQYGAQYIADYAEFRQKVLDKTVIPYQVEIQPASPSKEICWLKCPWCYGLSAKDTGERLSRERAIEIMRQIAAKGVRKIIFAGYATDPLNCNYLEDLLDVAVNNGQIFGFNTKAIKVSPRLLELLSRPDVAAQSYLSVSIDAGSNDVYNEAHAVKNQQARLYDRVVGNVARIAAARQQSGFKFDLSATYLINSHNNGLEEVATFIRDLKGAGCNLLRFAFPQLPRDFQPEEGIIPSKEDVILFSSELKSVIESQNSEECAVLLVDADSAHNIFRKPRTLPCFARFIYPSVGFDGWLYHCSQSSAPNFRDIALGNLATNDFWELFYNYDSDKLGEYLKVCGNGMATVGCRCDRKEHLVNTGVIESGVFSQP